MLLLYEFGLIAVWLTHPEEGNYFADLPMVQRGRQLMHKITKRVRMLPYRKIRSFMLAHTGI